MRVVFTFLRKFAVVATFFHYAMLIVCKYCRKNMKRSTNCFSRGCKLRGRGLNGTCVELEEVI